MPRMLIECVAVLLVVVIALTGCTNLRTNRR